MAVWGMAEKRRGIEKTREGVPIWDGDSSTFQEFEECALLWEQSIALHKRYLAGPRLVTELCGTARKFVIGKRPEWLSHNGGVAKLLAHLRQNLGLPQLPEMTELLTRYFKQGRRRRGEMMNEYITRKMEVYARARQSMGRLLKHYPLGVEQPSSRGSTSTLWQVNQIQNTKVPITRMTFEMLMMNLMDQLMMKINSKMRGHPSTPVTHTVLGGDGTLTIGMMMAGGPHGDHLSPKMLIGPKRHQSCSRT